jgi:hypothetical protein
MLGLVVKVRVSSPCLGPRGYIFLMVRGLVRLVRVLWLGLVRVG